MNTKGRSTCIETKGEGCWPTREQELLLRASLLEGGEAIEAWRKWKSRIDLDRIEPGSQRLLPLLYRNLHLHSVEDPSMNRYKGIHRRTWYENQTLFRTMSALLRIFYDAGIRTLILKGAALTLLHYRDYGLRPMDDFDILIPTEQAMAAINVLTDLDWRPKVKPLRAFTEDLFSVRHSEAFKDASGNELDLHWHVLHECCYDHADDVFWNDATSVELHDVKTRALHPTDQLLHVCIHGARWNVVPPIRWVADARILLKTSVDDIDWDRLVAQAQERCLTFRMRHTLAYVRDLLNAPVPPGVVRSLQETPVSRIERREYRNRIRPSKLGRLPSLWIHHQLLSKRRRKSGLQKKSMGFVRYLQQVWNIHHSWHVPFIIVTRGVRRFTKMVLGKIE